MSTATLSPCPLRCFLGWGPADGGLGDGERRLLQGLIAQLPAGVADADAEHRVEDFALLMTRSGFFHSVAGCPAAANGPWKRREIAPGTGQQRLLHGFNERRQRDRHRRTPTPPRPIFRIA